VWDGRYLKTYDPFETVAKLAMLEINPRQNAGMKATWNGTVIAESNDTVVVEGNHYFPLESVVPGILRASSHQTSCPWKGTAGYYSLLVAGETNANAAWFYAEPKEAAKQIKGRVAFWKGVQVTA
jgi:uncharacterized protein (DUF427 family)